MDEVTKKRYIESVNYCRDFIERSKIPFVEYDGYEADDIIALFCEKYHERFHCIIIVSNDSDLYQLFKYGESKIILDRGRQGIFQYQQYYAKYGNLPYDDFWKVGALAGTHNVRSTTPIQNRGSEGT